MTSIYTQCLTKIAAILTRARTASSVSAAAIELPRVNATTPSTSDVGQIKFGACMRPSLPSVTDAGRIKFGACMRPSLPSIADAGRIKFGACMRPANR